MGLSIWMKRDSLKQKLLSREKIMVKTNLELPTFRSIKIPMDLLHELVHNALMIIPGLEITAGQRTMSGQK